MSLPESSVIDRRQARIREAIEGLNLDALIVTDPFNVRYLSNHVGSAGIVVLTGEAIHLLIDFRYQAAVSELQGSAAACRGLRVWNVPGSYDEALVGCLIEIGVGTVGFEGTHISVARHEWLARTLAARAAAITLRSTDEIIVRARMIKDATEIAALRESAAALAPVVDVAVGAVAAGVAERAIAAVIERALREAGFDR